METGVGRSGGGNAGAEWVRMRDALPTPIDAADGQDLLWEEFAAHFRWYDRAASRCRYGYQCLRLVALMVAAAVTVLAAVGAPAALTASLAAVTVVAEGVQQLFQFHANWIEYRATAETLRQHAFLYAAGVAPYVGEDRRDKLADIMRASVEKERIAWSAAMDQTAAPPRKEA